MKRFLLATAVACAAMVSTPASAAVLVNGATSVAPTAGVPAGQGTVQATSTTSGSATTFAATFNQAVYRNAMGTLDFYYQVIRAGAGTMGNNEISAFTVNPFDGFLVDAFASATDPDAGGFFVAANNGFLADGITPSGSTTTMGRSLDGNVLRINFNLNGLSGTENSATYIFRTNATNFDSLGTFGVIDGSTLSGFSFRPIAAVPEPATWAMMLLGFGGIGMAMRRRRRPTLAQVA